MVNNLEIIKFKDLENIKIYHSNYNLLLIILFFCFGFSVLYFYNLYKQSKEEELKNQEKSNSFKRKKELLLYLTSASLLRTISIIYIVLVYNKTGLDLISFFNFLAHIIPAFIYLLTFYNYIGCLIEKFFELSSERRKVIILPTLQLILYFSMILTILLSLFTTFIQNYKTSFYLIFGIISFNSLMTSLLYLVYGNKILLIYKKDLDNTTRNRNIKETIFRRVVFSTYVVGLSYLTIGIIYGLVSVDFFGVYYPNFMELNLIDFYSFLFSELLGGMIIGYSKEEKTNSLKEFCESEDFQNTIEELKMKNYRNRFNDYNEVQYIKEKEEVGDIANSPVFKKKKKN